MTPSPRPPARAARTMYLLALDGLPIAVWWTTGRPRRPIYRTVGQSASPVWLFKSLATVKRHIKTATAQRTHAGSRYGYITVKVPA